MIRLFFPSRERCEASFDDRCKGRSDLTEGKTTTFRRSSRQCFFADLIRLDDGSIGRFTFDGEVKSSRLCIVARAAAM